MPDIMALVDAGGQLTPAIRFAADLAARHGGSLTALHVRAPLRFMMPAYGSPALLTELEAAESRRVSAAWEAARVFGAWAASLGVTHSTWQAAEGYVPDVLARVANWHDIAVLDGAPDQPWGSIPRLGSLVLKAGIACLILPPGARARSDPQTVVLGWNGSVQCIRAIRAALPFLRRAARVVLVRGRECAPWPGIARKQPDITAWLHARDVVVVKEEFTSNDNAAGHALLESTARWSADLLVAGAYGRSRFGEWSMGGATRHLLQFSDVPLLMRH